MSRQHEKQVEELKNELRNRIWNYLVDLRIDEMLSTAGGYKIHMTYVTEPMKYEGGELKFGDWLYTWEDIYQTDGIQLLERGENLLVRWTQSESGTLHYYPKMRFGSAGFLTLQRAVKDLKMTDPELQLLLMEYVASMKKLVQAADTIEKKPALRDGYEIWCTEIKRDCRDYELDGKEITLKAGDVLYMYEQKGDKDGIQVIARDNYYRVRLTYASNGATSYPKMEHRSRGFKILQQAVEDLKEMTDQEK